MDPENAGADPANPQSWNGYGYTLNNPLLLVDPDGRAPQIGPFGGPIVSPLTINDVQVGIAAVADFLGGVGRGVAASSSFGAVGGPSSTDTTINRLGQSVGSGLTMIAGGEIFKAGGGALVATDGTAAPVAVPAMALGSGLAVGATKNLQQLLHTPMQASGPKTVEENASDLSKQIGKNSVPYETPSAKGHIDLTGKAHHDKATNSSIPTPHVQERPKHVHPESGKVNLGPQTTRPATHQDVRTAERLSKEKG